MEKKRDLLEKMQTKALLTNLKSILTKKSKIEKGIYNEK